MATTYGHETFFLAILVIVEAVSPKVSKIEMFFWVQVGPLQKISEIGKSLSKTSLVVHSFND